MDEFIENLKIFWSQPVPIIGFTIGMVIIGILVIVSKTSIGKKALNKIKSINEKLEKDLNEATFKLNKAEEENKSIIRNKDKEINALTDLYEIKLDSFKGVIKKQNDMIKVICENSVNKNIKEYYKNYDVTLEDLPVNEIIENAKNEVKIEFEDRLKLLEDEVYGNKDSETTSE